MAVVSFPNQQYAFHDMKFFANGRSIKILELKFNISEEDEFLFANEQYPLAIQPGPVSPTGEVVILQSDYIAWTDGLPAGRNIHDDYYDFIVIYKPKLILPIHKKVLKFCKISSAEEGMSQGDKFMRVPLPFKFLGLDDK